MLRLVIIGVLLFRLTPIGSETAEALIAMFSDGDQAPDHDTPDPEHGCTTLVHHCGCHASLGVIRDAAITTMYVEIATPSVFVLDEPFLEPDPRNLLRPPAA